MEACSADERNRTTKKNDKDTGGNNRKIGQRKGSNRRHKQKSNRCKTITADSTARSIAAGIGAGSFRIRARASASSCSEREVRGTGRRNRRTGAKNKFTRAHGRE